VSKKTADVRLGKASHDARLYLWEKHVTLRIGQIDYANCTPIFTTLQKYFDCSHYHFVRGVPAVLNNMLARGEIDACPSSSIAYGFAPEKYCLLPGLSISSIGQVKSVLLFSRVPLADLNNQTIGLTAESATSVNLLRIILAKHYGFVNDFQTFSLPLDKALESFPALLLIGDTALREAANSNGLNVYDLGELWYTFTGRPFVFALWMVTRQAAEQKHSAVRALSADLLDAKLRAYDSYEEIAAGCRELAWMSGSALVDYWRTISYDLTPDHIEGVRVFYRYAAELGILAREPEIRIFENF
jgi:chorismate dehydratase